MDLSLTSEQRLLRSSALAFVREEISTAKIIAAADDDIGLDVTTWRSMAGLGWFSLAVPSLSGSPDSDPMDAVILMEALGHGPVPGPVFETAALAPALLAALPGTAACRDLMAAIDDGEAAVAVLLPAGSGTAATVASSTLTVTGDVVTGSAAPVREAAAATHFLALAADETGASGTALVIARAGAPGVRIGRLAGFAPRQYRVEFDHADRAGLDVVPLSGEAFPAIGEAVLASIPALCAFQVGSGQAVLDMSIAYSRERVQFGRPIGAFQRVQDHVIDLLNGVDTARWTTYYAASRATTGDRAAAIHVAKAVTARAHFEGCDSAHEVHAGIGVDVDYGLVPHTYLSRALYSYLGDPAWHHRQLVDVLGLRPPSPLGSRM